MPTASSGTRASIDPPSTYGKRSALGKLTLEIGYEQLGIW